MCGIVGFVGQGNTKDILLTGLSRLEYRGYDSAGIALYSQPFTLVKAVGKLEELKKSRAELQEEVSKKDLTDEDKKQVESVLVKTASDEVKERLKLLTLRSSLGFNRFLTWLARLTSGDYDLKIEINANQKTGIIEGRATI